MDVYKYEKISGLLNPESTSYNTMRMVGVIFIVGAIWSYTTNTDDSMYRSLYESILTLMMGIYFLFPKHTGFFKQQEFISIKDNIQSYNLNDIKNIKQINLEEIHQIQNRVGTIELTDYSDKSQYIPVNRILDKKKLVELHQYLDNRFSVA